jgi:hypothetical protein
MSPAIHLIDDLPAVLAIFRYRDGEVLVLANPSDHRIVGGLEPGPAP